MLISFFFLLKDYHSLTHLNKFSFIHSYLLYGNIVGSFYHELHLHWFQGYKWFTGEDALADLAVMFDDGSWHWTFDEVSFADSDFSGFTFIGWNGVSKWLALEIKEVENTVWVDQEWKFDLFIICSDYQFVIVLWVN